MTEDRNPQSAVKDAKRMTMNRRREVLRRMGQASIAAGTASPIAALATGSKRWCKHPLDSTKCVHATVSGMGSTLLSAQASNEVCGRKVSHYSSVSNWPGTCSGATGTITCNTLFKNAFNCSTAALDSNGVKQGNSGCLLDKSLLALCTSHSSSPEARWACALANANKVNGSDGKAPFPYTPAQVAGYYLSTDLATKAAAYEFFTTYCENYA